LLITVLSVQVVGVVRIGVDLMETVVVVQDIREDFL
jgi:hypothetical protein